ncbi:EamA family transporter [Komagataeibacter xylinus]|uniref:EamA family transporter n=1 Tax=Komagataeibacter xylinus TaxID=28448 RepID=A0A857FQ14_KOMXY|nr:EamA family transporter [Komagataeibacter xylinus]QHC35290.1 EamA family transporter [Komagataeibacter xylinus]
MAQLFFAFLCVVGISIGQILFKLCANGFTKAGSFYDFRSLSILLLALVLYGITTIGWIWVLQKIDLGRAYPIMALAFVIVPCLSYLFLGESFNRQYFVGTALIMAGILISVGSKI